MRSDLFVYGTLRSGLPNPFSRMLAESATLRGSACVRGQLFRIGDYPGAVSSSEESDRIAGEVWTLHNPEKTLTVLDDYEGREFARALTTARLDSGEETEAWIYWYALAVSGRARIESGDFLACR